MVGGLGLIVVALGVYGLTMNNSARKVTLEQEATTEKLQLEEKMTMEKKAMEEKAQMEKDAMVPTAAEAEGSMMNKDPMTKEPTEMKSDDGAMMKKDESTMMKKDTAMMSHGSYQVYSADKLALAETGDVVLFFKASWCPSCKAVDANIKANLTVIPAGLSILEVDYDTSAALKQKYGVTYQHTFVQVDSSGALITKWSGSPTLADIVTKVK